MEVTIFLKKLNYHLVGGNITNLQIEVTREDLSNGVKIFGSFLMELISQ